MVFPVGFPENPETNGVTYPRKRWTPSAMGKSCREEILAALPIAALKLVSGLLLIEMSEPGREGHGKSMELFYPSACNFEIAGVIMLMVSGVLSKSDMGLFPFNPLNVGLLDLLQCDPPPNSGNSLLDPLYGRSWGSGSDNTYFSIAPSTLSIARLTLRFRALTLVLPILLQYCQGRFFQQPPKKARH